MYEQHVIIDFEMNPVSKNNIEVRRILRNEIIEIGAVKLDSDNCEIDRFSCLVKPQYNEDIARFITGLTGIKTGAVKNAYDFENALREFSSWIGDKKTRIYSWSDTDLLQLRKECIYKGVNIPGNMRRWMDFQVIYPRVMGLDEMRKMSLADAADWYGVYIDRSKAHRALYDAAITAELVRPVLTGEYKKQVEILHMVKDNKKESGYILGDAYGDMFMQLMNMTTQEVEYAR